jgi:hypothetical protein
MAAEMGGRDDRTEPADIQPGAAAAAEIPAAGPTGLADALHGAPDLLAAVAAAAAWPGDSRPSLDLRLLSKACCEAVDAAATLIRLDFDQARQQADWQQGSTAADPYPEARPKAAAAGDGAWLARMERRLAKLPRLEELTCSAPSDTELAQLLAGPAVAGVQRLEMLDCTSGRGGPGEPGPSPTDRPGLQVRSSGWLTSPAPLPRPSTVPCHGHKLWPAPCLVPLSLMRLDAASAPASEGTAFT